MKLKYIAALTSTVWASYKLTTWAATYVLRYFFRKYKGTVTFEKKDDRGVIDEIERTFSYKY